MNKQKLEMRRNEKVGVFFLSIAGGLVILALDDLLNVPEIVGLSTHLKMAAVAIAIVLALHEGLHALFLRLFGGRVRIGFQFEKVFGPTLYVTSPGTLLSRTKFQIVCLAPQILTAVALVALATIDFSDAVAHVLLYVAAANLAGGGFDIYCVYRLSKLLTSSLVEDTKLGLTVYNES